MYTCFGSSEDLLLCVVLQAVAEKSLLVIMSGKAPIPEALREKIILKMKSACASGQRVSAWEEIQHELVDHKLAWKGTAEADVVGISPQNRIYMCIYTSIMRCVAFFLFSLQRIFRILLLSYHMNVTSVAAAATCTYV